MSTVLDIIYNMCVLQERGGVDIPGWCQLSVSW